MTQPTSGSPSPQGAQATMSVQNPLTLIMTVKSATDSQALQALLHKLQSAPPELNPVWTALNKLNTVHFARFVFLDANMKLAVITAYDGSFEDYINEFIDEIGDVFNALLAHMADAPPLPVQKTASSSWTTSAPTICARSSRSTARIRRRPCSTSRQRSATDHRSEHPRR